MPRQAFLEAFRGICKFDLAHNQTVIANDNAVRESYIGLGRVGALVLKGMFQEPVIQVRLSAIKAIEHVLAREFFYTAGVTHRAEPDWKNPGSERSFFNLGRGRAGASRAAWNAAQFSAFTEKMRRSASISSALESALSITKSLIER